MTAVGYYLVREAPGPAWDPSRPRPEQPGWEEHGRFMDALVAERFIVLGGPVGDPDRDDAVLLIAAESEEAVRDRLADDPWIPEILTIARIEPWTIWLGSPQH